jgi:hypothetical protein
MASWIGERAPRLGAVLLVIFAATAARAQPSSTKEGAAKALFDEGRALFDAGKLHEACEKFTASYALYKKGSTLLNLAICHRREGKLASAWIEFTEARAQAARDGNAEATKIAEKAVLEIGPQVPQLRLSFAERPQGLEVQLDGVTLEPAALDASIPIDPGAHELVARAPGKRKWRERVDATAGSTAAVTIPPLEREEATTASPTPQPPQKPPPPPSNAEPPRDKPSSTRRTVGFVAIGVGVVAAAGGTYFGVRALGKRSDAEAACAANRCDEGRAMNDQGVTSAWIANGAIAGAVVFGAVGAYLLLTSPSASAATRPAVLTF